MVEQRPQKLEQARELELRLVLDPDRPDDRHALGLLGGVVQEGRLPQPRLTAKHERAAAPPPSATEQVVDTRALGFPTDEHCSR